MCSYGEGSKTKKTQQRKKLHNACIAHEFYGVAHAWACSHCVWMYKWTHKYTQFGHIGAMTSKLFFSYFTARRTPTGSVDDVRDVYFSHLWAKRDVCVRWCLYMIMLQRRKVDFFHFFFSFSLSFLNKDFFLEGKGCKG